MRWKTKPTPNLGETRWVKKFAWFPVETDSGESLWLESYYVKERIGVRTSLRAEFGSCEYLEWVAQQTVTPELYKVIYNEELRQCRAERAKKRGVKNNSHMEYYS